MLRASLSYKQDEKNVTIITSDLRYIDSCTKSFYDLDDMIFDPNYWRIIKDATDGNVNSDDFHLSVIRPDGIKVEVPIIFNDIKPIDTDTSYIDGTISETEKARKLLHSSKNKMFLKSFIEDSDLMETANITITLTQREYSYFAKNGIDIRFYDSDDGVKVNIQDILRIYAEQDNCRPLRQLFEDSLDAWKAETDKLDSDELYYYSRNLRNLSIQYYFLAKECKTNGFNQSIVKNLKI